MDGDPPPLPDDGPPTGRVPAHHDPTGAPALGPRSPLGGPAPGPAEVPTVPAGRVSVALAGASLACFVVAVVLLVLPVHTPGVQDCGAPGAYLAEGRLDVVPDANDRILGPDGEVVTLERSTAATARDHPCQERVAARAVPAGALLLAGTIGGLGAFGLEVLVVRPRRRRAWRAVAEGSSRSAPLAGPDLG